jgi:hypothetical protein
VKKGVPDIPLFSIPGAVSCRIADTELHGLVKKAKKSGVGVKAMGLYFHPKDSFLRLYDPDLEVIVGSQ